MALSGGLAACGGGGSTDTAMMSTPQEMCEAGGGRYNADGSCSSAAEVQIEGLQAQIAALRTQLGLDPSDDIGASISELQSTLAALQKQADEATKMAAEAAAKDAAALHAGITEAVSNLTVEVTGVADEHGGGMAGVTVSGLTPGVGGDDVTKSTEPMLGMWQGTMLTDTNDDDASSTVVVYTDIEADERVAFGDVYELDGNGNLANNMVIAEANQSKIKASAFMHAGRMNHDPDPDSQTEYAMIDGYFNGASGQYRCLAASETSCASHDAGDGAVRLEGAWIFDPDTGAMATMADPSYAYFGWWFNKGTADGVEAGVFHGVTDLDGADAKLGAPTNINALGGTATYSGSAAGKYAINPGLSPASGGHWTADATLTAEWGDQTEAGNHLRHDRRLHGCWRNDGLERCSWRDGPVGYGHVRQRCELRQRDRR